MAKFTAISCNISDHSVVALLQCGLSRGLTQQIPQANYNLTFKQQLTNLALDFDVDLVRGRTYDSFLKLKKFPVCKLLEQIQGQAILKFVMEEMQRSSNLPRGCPFQKVSKCLVLAIIWFV